MTRLKGQKIQVQCGIVAISLFSLGVVMFCSSCISIQCEDSLARLCDPTNSSGRVSAQHGDLNGSITLQLACGGEA